MLIRIVILYSFTLLANLLFECIFISRKTLLAIWVNPMKNIIEQKVFKYISVDYGLNFMLKLIVVNYV